MQIDIVAAQRTLTAKRTSYSWTNPKGVTLVAMLGDAVSTGINAGYAAGQDAALLTPWAPAQALGGAMLLAYPAWFSKIPNTISTAAGALWAVNDFVTGASHLDVTVTDKAIRVSGQVGQDTIVAAATNTVGWFIPEATSATALDATVNIYDEGRSVFAKDDPPVQIGGLQLWPFPTIFSPSFSFSFPRP